MLNDLPLLRPFRFFAIALLCLLAAACSTLPDVSQLSATLPPAATPTSGPANASSRLNALAAMEEAVTGSPLIKGNKVSLLFDGPQTMTAMIEAIGQARSTINFETYIFDQDQLGQRFADLLIEKQRAGVQVNIIYDSVGSIGTPTEFFERMRASGIRLVEFNPVNPLKRFGRWQLNHRDHRKILVVDGKVAFTGGVNISAAYANSSLFRSRRRSEAGPVGWRDTHVRIEGPAVASLQLLFLQTWSTQHAEDLPDLDYFPKLEAAGDKTVHVLSSQPDGDYSLYKAYILAIQQARKSIHITTPYFTPDRQLVEALIAAAKRGVDVSLILPSVIDSGLVFHAGQSFYTQLLSAGIRIYQLQISVLHAKTAVIDGSWSTVGSANMDIRSFLHNYEANVIVIDDQFGREMERAFREDVRGSLQITLEQWQQRPFSDRIKEWAARSLGYWL
ncbi:cardiolipin synthase [Collimonas pratensis]|uniref:Cardiolipin synthase n=1 Tax=Collimonas pratensis TaxID=279113 RepID=A0A127Q5Y8_9BURK|nr:cardiolipin synthase [Collimonas pratensis]AMP05441.1 cardiolipin synthase [Collimonas pratensis]NKI69197.1 cardiolipin synthase [Collimonas pratensis]